MIANLDLYSKGPANQFAAKLATGAGNYDDLQNWSYWVMDDWQAGIGKKDAEGGGYLYGELESRFPNRLQLPRAIRHSAIEHEAGARAPDLLLPVGTTQIVHRVSALVTAPVDDCNNLYVALYLKSDDPVIGVKVAVYADSSGPASELGSATITLSGAIGYHYYYAKVSLGSAKASGTVLYVGVLPNVAGQTINLPVSTGGIVLTGYWIYNGTAWSQDDTKAFMLMRWSRDKDLSSDTVSTVAKFDGYTYAAIGATLIRDDGSTVQTFGADITALLPLGDTLYIGLGNSTNYQTMSTGGAFTAKAVPARLFAKWNGYLWRSVGNDVFYTGNGSTWTGPIEVTSSGWEIQGMAGLEDYLYCSCDDGLYYVGAGDLVLKVAPWAGYNPINGAAMLNYHGALFISLGQSIIRFDGNAMLPVGPDLGEGLPLNRLGNVVAMCAQNNWMMCAITPQQAGGQSVILSYNDQGWHPIATLPAGVNATALTYDAAAQYLWIATSAAGVFYCYLPDVANDKPANDARLPYAWLENDWFFGSLLEVQKDFESVYITGENLSATSYAVLYWQDDDSTAWELLGTVSDNRTEIRWSNYGTRPNSRQLKIGVALYTKTAGATPQINAIRIKYHPMVSDWFRWSFPILVSDNQQELGGTLSPYNAYQKRAHLDELTTQVPPLIFMDMDGEQYEVKVMGCQIQHTDVEWIGGQMKFESIYNLTIEAIRNGSYEA